MFVSIMMDEHEFRVLKILGNVTRLLAVTRRRRRSEGSDVLTEAPQESVVHRLEFRRHHEIPGNR